MNKLEPGLTGIDLAKIGLQGFSKVAIFGASGWFGREALELCLGDQGEREVRAFASKPLEIELGKKNLSAEIFSLKDLMLFEPELIIDAAFVTREHASRVGLATYEEVNRQIMEDCFSAIRIPSVRKVIGFSSGVVIPRFEKENSADDGGLYASLKRDYETTLQHLSLELDKDTTVLRTFSVSGTYNNRPRQFAFSSMVLDAMRGSITINSSGPVIRRYMDISDLIAVGLGARNEGFQVIESGGPILEIGELAEEIRRTVNPRSSIYRVEGEARSNFYASDGKSWEAALEACGIRAKTLVEQITNTWACMEKFGSN
jgi:nucleoside-diphosphate-sugar epimerase